MSAVKIIDTRTLAAFLFSEPEGEEAAALLADCELVAPPLLQFELADVCLIKCRRYPGLRDKLLAAFDLRNRLGIREIEVNQSEIVLFAEQTGLTAYDANYLWLAHVLDAGIVTFDREFQQVAAAAFPAARRSRQEQDRHGRPADQGTPDKRRP